MRGKIKGKAKVKYISTRGAAPILNFEETLLAGLASDGGLYVPQSWPQIAPDRMAAFAGKPYAQVAFEVLAPFIDEEIADARLQEIINESYACFAHKDVAPLVPLNGREYVLELFHGPTLAFKDIAMQLLARLMDEILAQRKQRATIVGATSGDTGGAAIEAFGGREAIDVFIFYPEGRVSDVQRKQMTTPAHNNVHAIAVQGTFDDCQTLVKAMFNDTDFRQSVHLAGVNSINWARVMAQVVYYFTSAVQIGAPQKPVAFCVPTGNFGDIFAGFVAAQMGLPIGGLMIATNVNDILVRALETGIYAIGNVVATASPSMDIQISSNFERLLFEASGRNAALVGGLMDDLAAQKQFTLPPDLLAQIKKHFSAMRVDETQMADTMRRIKNENGMVLDPHSAIGVAAAQHFDLPDTMPIVSLATAHAAKFPDAVKKACGQAPAAPPRIGDIMQKPERTDLLANDLATAQNYILQKSGRVSA